MTRTPPHPEPLRGSALSHEGRGEGKLASKRQIELITRIKKKRALSSPSPLVGEGGGAQRAAPGEGALPPVPFARKLRETMTDAERKLWHVLKDRRFAHLKFRRQVPMGRYVADFLSHEARLVVEIDGSQHADSKSDSVRDAWFSREGYDTLRVWNRDVLAELNVVLGTIAAKAKAAP